MRFTRQAWGQRRLARHHLEGLVRQGRLTRDGKYVEGRDGWLFVEGDTNDVFGQHGGSRGLVPEELSRWMELLNHRTTRLAARGTWYGLLVAPDTHSVYPEKLPEGTRLSRNRPVCQLLDLADRTGLHVRLIYPLDRMVEAKATRRVCSPIDSHWSDIGAFIAYESVVEAIGDSVPLRRLEPDEIVFQDVVGAGDLGVKLAPMRLGVHAVGIPRFPAARLLYDNCVENVGSLIVTDCPAAPPTTCLVFGDSYSYSLIKFVAESFRRVVLAHSPAIDWELVEQTHPDVVLSLMAERFLIEVPDDGTTIASSERSKRETGRTRPPVFIWFGDREPPPADVERLRAHLIAAGDHQAATIVSLLAYGGLIAPEVTSLRWGDIESGHIAIRVAGARIGEREPARRVPIMGPLAADLAEWKRTRPPAGPRSLVFPGSDELVWAPGEWTAWRESVFQPAVAACGLDFESPLSLRDVYCALLIHARIPPKEIARRVGEKPREIRILYGRLLHKVKPWPPADPETLIWLARRAATAAAKPAASTIQPEASLSAGASFSRTAG
jgi:hypothetical protein